MGATNKGGRTREERTERYVALLRGVNVGGKNRLAMTDFAQVLGAAGATEVRTYIQSGNAVFSASPGVVKALAQRVEKLIAERFSLRVPVVVRSAGDLAKVVSGNPFLKAGAAPETLHVCFLADAPDRGCVSALDPRRSPGDAFSVCEREVYLHLPNGVARTKLTNAHLDSKLGTTGTLRNWRTVLKLCEMCGANG